MKLYIYFETNPDQILQAFDPFVGDGRFEVPNLLQEREERFDPPDEGHTFFPVASPVISQLGDGSDHLQYLLNDGVSISRRGRFDLVSGFHPSILIIVHRASSFVVLNIIFFPFVINQRKEFWLICEEESKKKKKE
ncbi:unnamed protein product, partial [Linum tenue]